MTRRLKIIRPIWGNVAKTVAKILMVKLKVLNKYTRVLWNVKIRTTNDTKLLIEVKNVKKYQLKSCKMGNFRQILSHWARLTLIKECNLVTCNWFELEIVID